MRYIDRMIIATTEYLIQLIAVTATVGLGSTLLAVVLYARFIHPQFIGSNTNPLLEAIFSVPVFATWAYGQALLINWVTNSVNGGRFGDYFGLALIAAVSALAIMILLNSAVYLHRYLKSPKARIRAAVED